MNRSRILFLSLLLLGLSFIGGYWLSLRQSSKSKDTTHNYLTVRSTRPELQFFITSFCPSANQVEDILQSVYSLLSARADFVPHYIFKKITNLSEYCTTTQPQNKNCLVQNNYLKSQENIYYTSLYGRQETNQNIRELCAWKQVGDDKKPWWTFVNLVNKNCRVNNADNCWEEQGRQAGLDTYKITECFNQNAFTLVESEIATSAKYNITSTPFIIVNNINIIPETGTNSYRTPNILKEIICKSMTREARECATILPEITGTTPSTGGCGY
ncbi:MAG: hypothetical protein WAV41_03535 [Microgenomates group bacterium]